MFRVVWFAAAVAFTFVSQSLGEGIVFPSSDPVMGAGSTSPFVSVTTDRFAPLKSSSPLSFDASPPSTLPLHMAPATNSRGSSMGHLSSRDAHHILNPLGHLTSTTSSVFASPGRYDSGAASRLSTLPTASGAVIQQFQIPTTGFDPSSGLPGTPSSPLYSPAGSPQVYFGTK